MFDPIIGNMHLLQLIQVDLRNLIDQVIIEIQKSKIWKMSFGKFLHCCELIVGQ